MNPRLLHPAARILLLILLVVPFVSRAQEIRVTLLGTGSPWPVMNRFGPSTLVEAGGRKFVFDAGRGALQRLAQLKVRWKDVDGVFITHLHSDHVVGFPDLWLTGWLTGRDRPVKVWGPQGTQKMMSHLQQAFEADIGMRLVEGLPRNGNAVEAQDIADGFTYEAGGVKITAFEVDHGPAKPSFGYRIDHGGRSVVLSGDTRASDKLLEHAEGVDLLVHEVAVPETFERAGLPAAAVKSIVAPHVTPEQAGEVFSRTKPRLAVYSHVALPMATAQDLLPPTRRTYAGPLEVGEDLMVIEVGETIEVRRPAGAAGGR